MCPGVCRHSSVQPSSARTSPCASVTSGMKSQSPGSSVTAGAPSPRRASLAGCGPNPKTVAPVAAARAREAGEWSLWVWVTQTWVTVRPSRARSNAPTCAASSGPGSITATRCRPTMYVPVPAKVKGLGFAAVTRCTSPAIRTASP